MSDEDKKVEETTTSEKEETKSEDSKLEEDESKKPEESEVDYKALLEEEKTARKKAEHKIVKMKAKKLEDDDEVEVEDDTEDLKAYVDKKFTEAKFATLETQFESAIDNISANPDEKALIKEHLKNNDLSGTVVEKVQKAKALANYKKVAEVNKELAHSASVQAGGEYSSSYPSKPDTKAQVLSNLSAKDIAFLEKRGLKDKYIAKHGK